MIYFHWIKSLSTRKRTHSHVSSLDKCSRQAGKGSQEGQTGEFSPISRRRSMLFLSKNRSLALALRARPRFWSREEGKGGNLCICIMMKIDVPVSCVAGGTSIGGKSYLALICWMLAFGCSNVSIVIVLMGNSSSCKSNVLPRTYRVTRIIINHWGFEEIQCIIVGRCHVCAHQLGVVCSKSKSS